jgi:sporulation protein YlmC with PRC-barrel domain
MPVQSRNEVAVPRTLIASACLLAALAAGPALAQQQPPAAPAGDSHLTVATVRMNGGMRAGKIIGTGVTNDHNEQIGTIDDLMIADDNKVAVAVISVGGFLGIGSKLVAVPYDQLQHANNGKLIWPGASKQSLQDMPSFTYGS